MLSIIFALPFIIAPLETEASPPVTQDKKEDQPKKDEKPTSDKPPNPSTGAVLVEVKTPIEIKTPVHVEDSTQRKSKSFHDVLSDPERAPDWILVIVGIGATAGAIWNAILLRKQIALATSPRLYVSGVRASNFGTDKSNPTFFVTIRNDSQATAHNVRVSIRFESILTNIAYIKDPQIVTIAANAIQEYYICWAGATLSDVTFKTVTSAETPLRITGYFQEENKDPVTYCYKYNAWTGYKPPDVPEFIPCEFDMSRTVATGISGVTATATVGGLEKES